MRSQPSTSLMSIGSKAMLLFLMIMLPFLMKAQGRQGGINFTKELFDVKNENVDLNISQRQILSGWRLDGGSLESEVVAIKDIRDAVFNNRISVSLPGDTSKYTFVVKDFEQEAPDNYTWYGELKESYGYLFLLRRPEGFIGGIQTPTKYYSIAPLGKEFALVMLKDHSETAVADCGMDGIEAAQMSTPEICDEGFNTCPAVIDVLSIVTDNALAFLQNRFPAVTFDVPPFGQVQLVLWPLALEWAYANTNRALQNSDVPNKRFRFRTQIQNLPLTNVMENDGRTIRDNPIVTQLRNQHRADLVVVFTNQNYAAAGGAFLGPDPSAVHAIVEVEFSNAPRFTLAHEIAHMLGAQHNRIANGGDNNTQNCAHGWRFMDGNGIERRTIMALSGAIDINNPAEDLEQRSLLFSNPNIEIQGVAAGTLNDNNAQVMRNSGCFVSQYRAQPEWSAYLIAPDIVCRNQLFFQACANVIPPGTGFSGIGPYLYEIYLSIDFQQEQLISNLSCVNINQIEGDFLYLRIVVRSADNRVITLSKVIEVRDGTSPPCFIPLRDANSSAAEASGYKHSLAMEAGLFPNPTSGIISLLFNTDAEYYAPVSILVFDQCGKLLKQERITPTHTQYDLDLIQYSSGVYFVRISWDDDSVTHKIIKL